MKRSRRDWLKHLTAGMMTVVTLPGINWNDIPMTEAERARRKREDKMKRLEAEAAREVEEFYSTKPKRVFMAGREYVIPANYFGPKERDEPDIFHASNERGFGFYLFLPDYGGYTKENWRDPFDRRRISVLQVSPARTQPTSYNESKPQFDNKRGGLEAEPSLMMYGLRGYRWKNGRSGIAWTGTRSNGEFFFFKSSLVPGEPLKPGIENPSCQTQYYSPKEGLFIAYHYSQDHIAKWREIDDAIWAKLHRWQVK